MTLNKKKIFFLSGKRGGYDAMLPLLKKLSNYKNIDFKIILTDQHLLKNFGSTYKIVEKNFNKKKIIKLQLKQKNSSYKSRLYSMSNLLKQLTSVLIKFKPDLFIVYGDRAESSIAAFTCVNLNIPICHFQGGDLSGNIDEKLRHSITKMSDLHFASNKMSKKRIIQMGENHKYVFNIGDNHIDSLKKIRLNKENIFKKYFLNKNEEYCVLLLHPDGTSKKRNKHYIDIVIKALSYFKIRVFCIFPCTDIGYESIVDSLKKISKINKNFKVFSNLIYSDFINLIKFSRFFIGNSSSGIIESPYLKTPFLNLGNRQKNRLKSNNIISADFNYKDIIKKIKFIKSKKFTRSIQRTNLYYGNGKSYEIAFAKIIKLIKKIGINKKFNEIS